MIKFFSKYYELFKIRNQKSEIRNQKCYNHGFTLIELSIVLVIIGLLVGGVLAGQNLVQAARNKAQISQLQELQVAYNIFKLEYDEIPGDFDMADDYWGLAASLNGDGNGRITQDADMAYVLMNENIKFF